MIVPEVYRYFSRERINTDLREIGGAVRKSMGQNFLIDPNTIDRLIRPVHESLSGETDPTIIEIGPGLGAMTHRLLDIAPVTALELDPKLSILLRKQFDDNPRFSLIEGDARHTLDGLSSSVLCGNLPYYITTELILGSLRVSGVHHLFFLVQTEFAKRACAATAESSFTVYLRNFGEARLLERIPATCFYPSPSVTSSYFVLKRYPEKAPPEILEKLLRMSYRGKRKKIRNSWKVGEALLPPQLLEDTAATIGLDTEKRPEQIEIDAYFAMACSVAETLSV